MAQPIRFPVTVENVTRHTDDVASYRLQAERRLPRFKPGQFIHLTIEEFDLTGFWPDSRVFSVANAVEDRRTIDLTISRQGEYTKRILDQVKQGDRLWAKGPYGDFTVDASHGYRRVLFIAGGTGVTPFCAFMDAALAQGRLPVEEAVLHYASQTPDLLIYRKLADRCANEIPGFRVHYYSERGVNGSDASVRLGRVDLADLITGPNSTQDTAWFLSGPKAMIDSFRDKLTSIYGLSADQILIDAWE
jgi:ferredoxin-NADP reductase